MSADEKLSLEQFGTTADAIRAVRSDIRQFEAGSDDPRDAGGQCSAVSETLSESEWARIPTDQRPAHVIPGSSMGGGAYRMPKGVIGHAWVDLPGGHILDPTADQFRLGPDIRLIPKGHPLQRRYLRDYDGPYVG